MITSVRMLTKVFEGSAVGALRGVSFEVPEGCIYTLLGPSGCGKTTTLRSVAGLEEPTSGSIEIDGREVFNSETGIMLPAEKRNVGMVFQSYAIWPHMSVFENVAFPLKVPGRRRSASDRKRAVEQVLDLVELGPYIDRPATKLSGGQQQRLALARALVSEPGLLLLDEPLSNLDAKLRDQMRLELSRLQRDQGFTAIYVTHDQLEALSLSHRIAVMKDGVIVQDGTPHEIYSRPRSRFIAGFIGRSNFLDGTIDSSMADGSRVVKTEVGKIAGRSYTSGLLSSVAVCIRPEDIRLSQDVLASDGQNNVVGGDVDTVLFHGEATDVMVRLADLTVVQATLHSSVKVVPGDRVYLSFPVDRTVVVPQRDAELEEPALVRAAPVGVPS